MSRQNEIEQKLKTAFNPISLDVINESHKHQGHSGSPNTGESHYIVKISSPLFDGLSRVACHQLIYQSLEAELTSGLHALSIKIT